jgi:2,4-diketo-3-deoxy-L-fuconate hydrolase
VYDLTPVTEDIDGVFLAVNGIGRAQDALHRGTLPVREGSYAMRIGLRVARPAAVIRIGQNCAAHV